MKHMMHLLRIERNGYCEDINVNQIVSIKKRGDRCTLYLSDQRKIRVDMSVDAIAEFLDNMEHKSDFHFIHLLKG